MTASAELLALGQSLALCQSHQDALQDALSDLGRQGLLVQDLEHLDKGRRRLLDQFAYRYTRLQDDMGAKLIPAILRALGEEIDPMPVLDRLNRMEQLGWLPSADEWIELRGIRNKFAHDYPDTVDERFARFQLAMKSALRISGIFQAHLPPESNR
jgi:hypothetical protein